MGCLPAQICQRVKYGPNDLIDVVNIVMAAANFPDGLRQLIDCVRQFEGDLRDGGCRAAGGAVCLRSAGGQVWPAFTRCVGHAVPARSPSETPSRDNSVARFPGRSDRL